MATINYGTHTISDEEIKNVLQAICDFFEADVNVTSGDRGYVPDGGSKTSDHLAGRAADFHVQGYDDAMAYRLMKAFPAAIFASRNSYQIIWHGGLNPQLKAHIHIGRSGGVPNNFWGLAKFQQEGTKQSNIGIYNMTTDAIIQLIGVPAR